MIFYSAGRSMFSPNAPRAAVESEVRFANPAILLWVESEEKCAKTAVLQVPWPHEIRGRGFVVAPHTKVCDRHFDSDRIHRSAEGRRFLTAHARPWLFGQRQQQARHGPEFESTGLVLQIRNRSQWRLRKGRPRRNTLCISSSTSWSAHVVSDCAVMADEDCDQSFGGGSAAHSNASWSHSARTFLEL